MLDYQPTHGPAPGCAREGGPHAGYSPLAQLDRSPMNRPPTQGGHETLRHLDSRQRILSTENIDLPKTEKNRQMTSGALQALSDLEAANLEGQPSRQHRWLVIEPHATGHHSAYLQQLVRGAMDSGIDVTLGSSPDEDAARLCQDLQREHGPIRVAIVTHPLSSATIPPHPLFPNLRREIAYYRFFRKIYAKTRASCQVDRVFVPYLDYCLNAIGLFGSPFGHTTLDGICMRPSFHYAAVGVIAPRQRGRVLKRMLFGRLLRASTTGRVFTIDETLHQYQNENSSAARKLHFLPDPAELQGEHTRESARVLLGIPEEVEVILLYGAISLRKGLAGLTDRLKQGNKRKPIHLLIVGRQSEDAARLLAQPDLEQYRSQGLIHVVNRYVSPEEEQMVFAASDVVWLRYDGFYQMSGVLVKAVKAGLELELPETGLLGWYRQRIANGETLNFEQHNWAKAKRMIFSEDVLSV